MLFTQLRAFNAIVTEGSFTKAAQSLNLTQPTVSAHINMLEAYYGVVLFERRGRDITLTKTGEHLSGLVHRMFDVGARRSTTIYAPLKRRTPRFSESVQTLLTP